MIKLDGFFWINFQRIPILICLLIIGPIPAQSIRINEIVSSNSNDFDEDGDTPDWIELYNYGSSEVSLENWSISDDPDETNKWNFPDISLNPDEYLVVWASSKNRSDISHSRTFVNQETLFSYLIPSSEPDSNWTNISFDDSQWEKGVSSFGYGDGDDATPIPYGTQSVYLRIKFEISELTQLTSLILDMDYDDAFVAYINGREVARANINGSPPAYNSGTIQDHEAAMYSGGIPERFLVDNPATVLNQGQNILSIQAHNISEYSSDFTITPFLSAIFSSSSNDGQEPPEILGLNSSSLLHSNFKISSEETIILNDSSGNKIDEVTLLNLPPDTSYGVGVNSNNLVYFTETTLGYVNSNSHFEGVVSEQLNFTHPGGVFDDPFYLVLFGSSVGQTIRYTTDQTIPTENDAEYVSPIQVNSNTVIRARIFKEGLIPSPTFTRTFISDAEHQIDTVFLTTDPDHLFDDDTGIYVTGPSGTYENWEPYFGANFWEDWERPIHFSFYEYENSNAVFEVDAGVKIFGGWSRGQNAQRSLALFARGKYGASEFEHPFFNELSYDRFQAVVLRNSGQDWLKSSIKDVALTSLMRNSEIDFQENNPVATYINGMYWGLYNMREKTNEHMLASKHGINPDDIILLENNGEVIEGNNDAYNELISYINSTDLTSDINFQYVSDRVDLKNYIIYQVANIFFNNTDWPGNNIKFWTHPNGKWRWILYDTDFAFGPFWNTTNYDEDTLRFALDPFGPGWPNPPWSTLLFRKLITNLDFRNSFINRYADELNTRFLSENIKTHLDDVYQKIQPEIEQHYQRWGQNPSNAEYFVNEMKNFAEYRPSFAKEHIQSQFVLPNIHSISVLNNDISHGYVKINDNIEIQQSSWTGDYFESVPIKLSAMPAPGYEFSHWSGSVQSNEASISIDLVSPKYVTAHFVASQSTPLAIVINEINYKSGDTNADDWIELYNPNSSSVDLSNWQVKDDDDSHSFTIPASTTIAGEGYIIVVKDTEDFTSVFPDISNFVGDLGYGLGSSSDAVRLYDANGILQDQVYYASSDPWSDCPDETGYTLELKSPELDNNLAENWTCFNELGSPNQENNTSLSSDNITKSSFKPYPNPTKDILNIGQYPNEVTIEIFDVNGQKLITKKQVKQVDVRALELGVYFIKIKTMNKVSIHTFIKI